jgi:DNA-binding MarR family transcriptional regulator
VQATSTETQVAPSELASELLDLWLHLARGTMPGVFVLVEELGLSMTQMKTLHTLDMCMDELSVKALSEELHLSLPAASRVADGLLKRGYVERREDEHDRRMKRIRITPEGRDVVERMQRARLVGLEQFAASLSPDQRRELHAALAGLPDRTTEGQCR